MKTNYQISVKTIGNYFFVKTGILQAYTTDKLTFKERKISEEEFDILFEITFIGDISVFENELNQKRVSFSKTENIVLH